MNRIVKFKKFLEEVELTLGELGKMKDGQFRGNILVQKLKDNQPITTSNNRDVRVDKMKHNDVWVKPEEAIDNITDPDGNYDIDKAQSYFKKGSRFIKVFKDEEESEYQLNQFKKTKEFGSRGAGRLVREFESIQCIFLAIRQAYPDRPISKNNIFSFFRKFKSDPQNEELLKLGTNVEIDEDLLEDFLQDEDWLATFYKIPNRLWTLTGNYIDRNIKYMIYHVANKDTDSIYVILSNKFKELSKEGKFNDINITKWCPADVYMVSVDHKAQIIQEILQTKSISDLNLVVDKHFDIKRLIPLSLKKITMASDLKIITNREVEKELPTFEITNMSTNSDALKGIGSKISTFSIWKYKNDKNVDVKSRVLNLDSSDSSKKQDIDGEVEGSSSRHGKISFAAIKRIIDSVRGKFIFQNIQLTSELSNYDIDELKEIVFELKKSVSNISPSSLVINTTSPRATDISESKNKLISKIQSLQIVLAMAQIYQMSFDKVTKKHPVSDDIITRIMRYALSIQTDKFDTPRYLRVM